MMGDIGSYNSKLCICNSESHYCFSTVVGRPKDKYTVFDMKNKGNCVAKKALEMMKYWNLNDPVEDGIVNDWDGNKFLILS